MTAHNAEISAEVPCYRCGYDLRAHPADGKCPECAASVAESRRLAAIPRRPAWRDADPRWRRRILTGLWLLVLLPLLCALTTFSHWRIPMPNVLGFPGGLTLDESFLTNTYEPLLFCMGVVLLFSRERDRRPGRSDWTRRWGVLCSYIVLLLSAAELLYIAALVLIGIAALFMTLPPAHQPAVTQWFVDAGWLYLHYGPYPKDPAALALVAFSCITILLACVPLFDALRSSGPKWLAAILLAPLALLSLMHLAQIARYCLGASSATWLDIYFHRVYFSPEQWVGYITGVPIFWSASAPPPLSAFLIETIKWCLILAIAVRLTIAQLASWRRAANSRQVEMGAEK